MSQIGPLSYLTDDIPGIGGTIRQRPEDFLVEEQPLYEPAGEGEHVYLFVEKTNMTTMDAVRRIAKAFHVKRRDVGYAGLKDKRAITRQHFSVYQPDPIHDTSAVEHINFHPNLTVHWSERHTNKLRQGHHAGNRFVIRIRGVSPTKTLSAKRVLDRLAETGVPNFLGEQRFGYRQNGHLLGRLLLLGDYEAFLDEMLGKSGENDVAALQEGREAYRRGDYAAALKVWPKKLRYDRQALDALRQGKPAEQVVRTIDRTQRQFLICALQSAVFNAVLNRRLREGTFARLIPGDLAWKHDNRSVFAVDEQTAELENAPNGRVAALAISPSGPMWSQDMTRAAGKVDEMECAALAEQDVTLEQLAGVGDVSAAGSRRPLRVPLRDPDIEGGVDEQGEYIRVAFELPRGAFATIVLREMMKND